MVTTKKGLPGARQQKTPLTPEEQKEQIKLAFLQKKAELAENILYSMMQNPNVGSFCRGESVVKVADELATEFIKVVYGQELKLKEETSNEQ